MAMTRAEYLEANSISRTKPWKAEGISRAKWYRRKRENLSETSPSERSARKTSAKAENDNNINNFTANPEKLDVATKNLSINISRFFRNIDDEKEVIIVMRTRRYIILTTKIRYKNCKDYDKLLLKDRPDFTVTKSYSNNWRNGKSDYKDDFFDWEEMKEEMRDWNKIA